MATIQFEQTVKSELPVEVIQEIVRIAIDEFKSDMSLPEPIEYYNNLCKKSGNDIVTAVAEIASILKRHGKVNGNGIETVKAYLKSLSLKNKLFAINATGHENIFRMSDIYALFKAGEFDNI